MEFQRQILNSKNPQAALPLIAQNRSDRKPLANDQYAILPTLLFDLTSWRGIRKNEILETESEFDRALSKCSITKEEHSEITNFLKVVKEQKLEERNNTLRLETSACDTPYIVQCFADEESKKIQDSYILTAKKGRARIIGVGSQKIVTLSLHAETNRIYACASGKFCKSTTPNEIKAHEMLADEKEHFVVGQVAEYFEDTVEKVKKFAIFTEWMHLGDLERALPFFHKHNNTQTLLTIAKKIVFILDRLHSHHGLVHGDIKLANFFLDPEECIKLGDFGFTEKIGTESEPKGSYLYAAPETVNNPLNTLRIASEKTDIWSLGILFTQLSHGDSWYTSRIIFGHQKAKPQDWCVDKQKAMYYVPPAAKKSVHASKQLVLTARKDPESLDSIANECLQFDLNKRPSAKTLMEKLKNVKNL